MNLYSIVPEKNLPDKETKRQRILLYPKAIPEKFVTARQIAADCGYTAKNTQCLVRLAITELIEIDHQPIVSNGKGFAYTNDTTKIQATIDVLFARTSGIHRRIVAYAGMIR